MCEHPLNVEGEPGINREQLLALRLAQSFAAEFIVPWVEEMDQSQETPLSLLEALRCSGLLGLALPRRWGGGGLDAIGYGLATEEIGKSCSSIRSLMTVHNMTSQVIAKFGNADQCAHWLPQLVTGAKIAAFALTEPDAGSSVSNLKTTATAVQHGYVLSGHKKWITYGQLADCYLVFAQLDNQRVAFVVDRNCEGLTTTNVVDMLGTRGSMLADITFNDVLVPKDNQIGPAGMSSNFVINTALDHGRYSVAWGCTGIIQGCLDACVSYVNKREQGGSKLRDYQLIRRQITEMLVSYTAARSLCLRSARLRNEASPRSIMETSVAKYFAAEAAIKVSQDAVRLHGANGCSANYPVARYLRDAMIMGIIEGTREIHQLSIANYAFQRPYVT